MRLTVLCAATLLALAISACSDTVFVLARGDCFNDAEDGVDVVADLPVVDCAEPHDNEAFASFDLPDGPFPGLTAAQDAGFKRCVNGFEAWAGAPFHDSTLQVSVITPTEQSWELKDDRTVTCVAFREDGAAMSGSMQGAGA